MKKLKIVVSCILAMVMLAVSTVPVFANEEDDLSIAKAQVLDYAYQCESLYVFYYHMTPIDVPIWSNESTQRMKDVVEKVRNEVDNCATIEEVDDYHALLDDAVGKMCISSSELQWMLDYMKNDYNSTGYYEDETYSELKNIYETAQSAIKSGIDIDIHNAYIDMRNELNKLCGYNLVRYDVNMDGEFNIKDCTLMQLKLADLMDFNSSQNYVAGFYHNSTIKEVTEKQLMLANLSDIEYVKEIETNFVELDPSIRNYLGTDYETSNPMYNYDRYVWWT